MLNDECRMMKWGANGMLNDECRMMNDEVGGNEQ